MSTCHFQGNYALVGDAIREVVWTIFTYGGCNKGGSSVVLCNGVEFRSTLGPLGVKGLLSTAGS
jgi:hypothetical protein